MRTTFPLSVTIMLLTAVSVALAGEPTRIEAYQFNFDGKNGAVDVGLNSETMGFGLSDLQPGESRTTVTEDGSGITISRLADVYSLDLGGEIFEIPARHGPDSMTGEFHERRIAISLDSDEGLTIISKEPLDESRRATIRSALSAAGIVEEIEFLSPDLAMSSDVMIEKHIEDDGEGSRRVIVKRVIAD